MNMMLLVAATFLGVVSSELVTSLEQSQGYEGRLSSRYDEEGPKFGEEPLGGQDIKNNRNDRPNDRKNRNLNEKETEYDQTSESNWLDAVPGVPGKDYPNLESIPNTSFSCADKKPGGYYADVVTRCQVFHVCNVGGVKSSFLCPPGSIFNQKYLVCDWWYDFECENASELYPLNESINRGGVGSGPSGPEEFYTTDKTSKLNSEKESPLTYQENNWVNDGVDLSLAGTGEGGLGYSRNKSNRPFGDYQTNINQEIQSENQPGGIADLLKPSGRKTTLGNDRRNELSQRGSGQNADQSIYLSPRKKDRKDQSFNSGFRNENFNNVNNFQGKSEDYLSLENGQFSDYAPRGFAVNYGKAEKEYSNFNQEIENNQRTEVYDSSSSVFNAVGKELNSGQENYYNGLHKGNKNKNTNTRGNSRDGSEDAVLNSNSDEDEFERERQREVDNTILNKKINDENKGLNYEYDPVTEKLTSENPPSYYDNEKYLAVESYVPFPQNAKYLNYRIQENPDNSNRNLNKDRQSNGERRSTGGFRNGLGNGFPSPNKKLAGSNAIAGTTINFLSQKSEGYSNSRDIPNFNSQSSANKETGYTDVRPSTENNGFFGDDVTAPSSVKISSGSRSFGQITEITGRDNSETIKDEFTFRHGNNLAKESFEIGFNGNENRRNENAGLSSTDQFRTENKNQQNLNHKNERNQYVPTFNY